MAETTSAGSGAATRGVWKADPYHTQVEFAAKHLGMMTVRGHFNELSVDGHLDPDHPEATAVQVTIQTASIRTHNEARDNDLRGSNFLGVDQYPTITFSSTKVEQIGPDRYDMSGDLTIKGVTKPVTLKGTVYGELNDPMMGHRISYSAQTKIDRRDYGLTFNMMLDGRWLVSNEVELYVEGEIVEQKPEPAAGAAGA